MPELLNAPPSILVTVLCHHDAPRLARAVRSALDPLGDLERDRVEVAIIAHAKDPTWSTTAGNIAEEHGAVWWDFHDPHTTGAPTGKQACLDVFLASGREYLVQVDGDDLLYPSWLASIDDHVRRCHRPDAVAWYPADRLQLDPPAEGLHWPVRPGVWATVWTGACRWNDSTPLGPGRGGPWGTWPLGTPARVVLWSRAAADRVHLRNLDQGGPEDMWLLMELLDEYLDGTLNVWTSMTSDVYLQDRTTPNNDQETTDLREKQLQALRMAEKAAAVVDPLRSSPGEFPVIWPTEGPGLISVEQKTLSVQRAVDALPWQTLTLETAHDDHHHHDDGPASEGPVGH